MVEIYRVGQQVEILNSPQTLSGEGRDTKIPVKTRLYSLTGGGGDRSLPH